MSDLAGFDLLVQVRRESIEDIADHVALPLPPGSTTGAHLFGGPFVLAASPAGWSIRAEVAARLEAVTQTNRTRLVLQLDSVVAVPPGGADAVALGAGRARAETAIEARPVTDADGRTWLIPTLVLSTAEWLVELDPNAPLPPGMRQQLEQAVAVLLANLLGIDHQLPLSVVQLRPGVDSHDPLVCPTAPVLCWIDAETLGIFVLYRDVPVPDPTRFRTAELESGPVFFYDPEMVMARQLRISLSRAGFEQVVRWQVVHELCARAIRQRLLAPAFAAVDRGPIRIEVDAEFADRDPAPGEQERLDEVELRAHRAAEQAVTDFLASPPGRRQLDAELPPPVGAGRLLVDAELPAYVTSCDLRLADGYVSAGLRAEAEPPCGSIVGTQQLRILMSTDGSSIVARPETDGAPEVEISASLLCQAVAALLGGVLAGPVWALFGAGALQGTAAFLQWTVGTVARDLVPTLVENIGPQSLSVPPLPVAHRLTGVMVSPDEFSVNTALAVSTAFNDIRPRLQLRLSVQPLPVEPTLTYEEVNPDRRWGCPARTFTVSTQLLATRITAELHAENVALPWRDIAWTVQAGNRHSDLDPQPVWSGPAPSVAAHGEHEVTVAGPARFPDPRPAGRWIGDHALRLRAAVSDASLTLQAPAGPGDRYLRIQVAATDAVDRVHTSETFVVLEHERSSSPPGYEAYHRECAERLSDYLADLTSREPPPRLRPVRGRPGLFRVRPLALVPDLSESGRASAAGRPARSRR